MPNNLMVLQDAWHWRKANYWDMPKCATCEHHEIKGKGVKCMNRSHFLHNCWVHDSYGCIYHSSIDQPENNHSTTEPR